MDFGKLKGFFISCLTTFHVQLKRDQSLHTYNMPRHSASSLVITEARFRFLDTENKKKKTPKKKYVKGFYWAEKQ